MFNPLQSPICFKLPERLSGVQPWTPHIPFAFALVEALRPRLFVELGTHRGDSYCAFCQAVQELQIETRCCAVDTWKGDEQSGVYGPEVLDELREYHDPRYGKFSQLLPMTFDAAQADFADSSIDLLHIDGLHTYEAVRHDFEHWLPKLSERGVVLFHDILVRERDFGVWKLWEELSQHYPHFTLNHGYGLGVLMVGREVPGAVGDLSRAAQEYPAFDAFFDTLGARVNQQQQILWREIESLQQREYIAKQHAEHHARQAQIAGQQQQLDEQARQLHAQAQNLGHLAIQTTEQAAELQRQAATIAAQDAAHDAALAEYAARLAAQESELTNAQVALAAAADQIALQSQAHDRLLVELHGTKERLFQVQSHYAQLRFRFVERLNGMLRRAPWLHGKFKSAAFSQLKIK